MSLLYLGYLPVYDLNIFQKFKKCMKLFIKVFGFLYFSQYYSSRWIDDYQRTVELFVCELS